MSMFSKAVKYIDLITDLSGRVCSWAVLVLNGVVVYEVIARYFFNSPSVCNFEITKYIFGFHFMMLGAYVLLKDEHVTIDIFQRKFSKRAKKVVDVICFACLYFPFSFVLFWNGVRYARIAWEQKERCFRIKAPVTWRPPHRPVREDFPHTVPRFQLFLPNWTPKRNIAIRAMDSFFGFSQCDLLMLYFVKLTIQRHRIRVFSL